jgi:hypothetical protein
VKALVLDELLALVRLFLTTLLFLRFRLLRGTHQREFSGFTRRLHFKAKGHGVFVPCDRSHKIEGESVVLSATGLGKLITVRFACSKRRN